MTEVTLYYDGKCSICVLEVEVYRKADIHQKLAHIDIASTHFDASSIEIPADKLNKYFHVQLADGHFVEGVESFIEVWKQLPKFQFLAKLASFKLVYFFMHIGYVIFAQFRPYLPKKKCTDNYCEIKFKK